VRVALVHDYLTQHGGAERVLEVLHEQYPGAPVFTSLYDPDALPVFYRSWDIRASKMSSLPGVKQRHRLLLPFYPALFRAIGRQLRGYDLILADSSAWSHHAAAEGSALICYCHSPARFLYGDQDYLQPAAVPGVVSPIAPALYRSLRALDRRAAARVDRYIANSQTVARRIQAVYGRSATVIYPPVDIERFDQGDPGEPEDWYLVISRLVPHKRVDLAIEVCRRRGVGLKVVGDGRALSALRAKAGPTVELLGYQDDGTVAELLRRCRALILPAKEDFGITPVEAQASGRPVIAYGQGGALETVIPGETGLFFTEQTPESLAAALDAFETMTWDSARIRENARRFGRDRFKREIAQVVDEVMARRGATGRM
jgi:glycosyltransferase involved in cell wall biosynthesis